MKSMKNLKKVDLSGYCHGITTVGERGQIVIPQDARQKLKIKQREKLFVFSKMGRMLIIIKTDEWNNLINMFMPSQPAIKGTKTKKIKSSSSSLARRKK